jgi:hypothetical protein
MDAARKVLVVDDHKAIREGLRSALGEFGYSDVDEAPDAETALEMVLASPPGRDHRGSEPPGDRAWISSRIFNRSASRRR